MDCKSGLQYKVAQAAKVSVAVNGSKDNQNSIESQAKQLNKNQHNVAVEQSLSYRGGEARHEPDFSSSIAGRTTKCTEAATVAHGINSTSRTFISSKNHQQLLSGTLGNGFAKTKRPSRYKQPAQTLTEISEAIRAASNKVLAAQSGDHPT